ncbi:MAG TPA: sugar phosphate nucleotidyltransferase [Candidatus Saccharimonadales bacterium]|nr:sugar phosphate nucleotidyltransferase [Candidatus Saccharimonadales bacterium]
MKKVKKAVIAAAGFGTRFLPQTKAMPKEMLPLIDKPIIQYIVEDLVAAGIEDIIIVTGYTKRNIEDHFDTPNEDLLNNLRLGGSSKEHYISSITAIADMANYAYVRQKGPYGPATPIMNAAPLLGDEPFIYSFADDITVAKPNMFEQMISMYEKLDASIVPCLKVTEDRDYERYGILGGEQIDDSTLKAKTIIEKPGKAKAPSSFAGVGGYLLKPEVFHYIEEGKDKLRPGQEFYVTDSLLQPMLDDGRDIYGYVIQNSTRYDTGNPVDYIKTVIDFALGHEEIGPSIKEYLKKRSL